MSIEAIGKAVPSIIETAADIAIATGADEAFVRNKVGVEQRYRLAEGETGVSLAAAAMRDLLQNSSLEPDQIDLLIYVTQNPDRRIPHNAAPLADLMKLRPNLASFDLSLGCSGFVYALVVAESMLAADHGFSNAVVVTCDPYSRIMDSRDKTTNVVFGDAATATWISQNGTTTRTIATDFGTDGSGAHAIRIDAGGAAYPLVSLDKKEGVQSYERESLRLHMEGREVFNFVNSTIPVSINNCFKTANVEINDVDYFALHQGSAYMLEALARRVRIPTNKLLMNIGKYGNTVSSTVPLLLQPLLRINSTNQKLVLISGFGVGLSWATAILELTPEN